jgi:hydroxyacylglutathione hydrolase
MLEVTAIPILEDNYVWLLTRGKRAAVVDPGEAPPVRRVLEALHLTLEAIVLTHHHGDHVGGVAALATPGMRVYASDHDRGRIVGVTDAVSDGHTVTLLDTPFRVMATPGHTLGAVCYYGDGVLFTGDTMFSAGCGRLFEGTAEQMFGSLQALAALPETTRVYCGHEYTEKNLRFAATVEPDNAAVKARQAAVATMRAASEPSLPSSIGIERDINPFLRAGTVAELKKRRKARDGF